MLLLCKKKGMAGVQNVYKVVGVSCDMWRGSSYVIPHDLFSTWNNPNKKK